MGGSIAQEMGHDLTIMYFVDKVLKPSWRELFFIVSPAMGPAIDIHFRNPEHNEYTSAWDTSRERYIPDYALRLKLGNEIMKDLAEKIEYWKEPWYVVLSEKLGRDLKEFVDEKSEQIIEILKINGIFKLPDFIGIANDGKVTCIGEIKYENLPRKALPEILRFDALGRQLEVPFYLVFPEKGFYARTDYGWIKKNVPPSVELYAFGGQTQMEGDKPVIPIVVPAYDALVFEKMNERVFGRETDNRGFAREVERRAPFSAKPQPEKGDRKVKG